MKNMLKNQKGSITLFVLVSMLFMTMFLMTIYTLSTNNEISERNATKKLKEKYEVGLDRVDEIYNELKRVKAYDQYGNEIEDFGRYWDYDYYSGKLALRIKDKEEFESKIDETTGKLQIQVPYYLIIGDTESYVESYFTYLKDDEGNYLDSSGNITTNSSDYVGKGLFQDIKVEKLDLDGSIKTDKIMYMIYMFRSCQNLTTLILGENFIMSGVTDMTDMLNCNTTEEALNVTILNSETYSILTDTNNADELGINNKINFINESV